MVNVLLVAGRDLLNIYNDPFLYKMVDIISERVSEYAEGKPVDNVLAEGVK